MKKLSLIWPAFMTSLLFACNTTANSSATPTLRPTVALQPAPTEAAIKPIESQPGQSPSGLDMPVITYGEIKEGQLSGPNQIDEWVFNAQAGERVNIMLNSQFDNYLELYGPDNEFITSSDDTGDSLNAGLFDLQLTKSGPHTLRVRGHSGATGGYTLALTGGHPAAGGGTIASGESRTVMLSRQGFKWHFQGRAGDYLTITINADDLIDPQLWLFGPDGTLLAEDDDSGGGLNPEIFEVALPVDGAYTIRAQTADRPGLVTLNLSSSQQASGGGPLAVGSPQTGALKPGRTHQWNFSGQAGQIISLTMNSAEFDTFLELRNSQGVILAENDDASLEGGTNSSIDLFTLPADDTYTVAARSATNNQGGNYNLTLKLVKVAPGGGPLAPDQPVQAVLLPGQTNTWLIKAEAGAFVTIQVQSDLLDSYLELYGPEGTLLAKDDDSGGGLNAALLDFPIEESGEYQLVVKPAREGRNQGGVYNISLSITGDLSATGRLAAGETKEASLSQGEQHTWIIEAAAGDTVTARMESDAIDTYLALYNGNGALLTLNDDFNGSKNAVIDKFIIPAGGQYRLVARAYSAQEAGDYAISLDITP